MANFGSYYSPSSLGHRENSWGTIEPDSAYRGPLDSNGFGVLKLTLKPTSTDYAFTKTDGTSTDTGTINCHQARGRRSPADYVARASPAGSTRNGLPA